MSILASTLEFDTVRGWYAQHKNDWWKPGLFKSELCSDMLFPFYLALIIKEEEDKRMEFRWNKRFPDALHRLMQEVNIDVSQDPDEWMRDFKKLMSLEKEYKGVRLKELEEAHYSYAFSRHGLYYLDDKTTGKKPNGEFGIVRHYKVFRPEKVWMFNQTLKNTDNTVNDYFIFVFNEHEIHSCRYAFKVHPEHQLYKSHYKRRDNDFAVHMITYIPAFSDITANEHIFEGAGRKFNSIFEHLNAGQHINQARKAMEFLKTVPIWDDLDKIYALAELFERPSFQAMVKTLGMDAIDVRAEIIAVHNKQSIGEVRTFLAVQDSIGVDSVSAMKLLLNQQNMAIESVQLPEFNINPS